MVYIHGGGFVSGSSREWGYKEVCRKLVSHGLIVVTLNYRLGPFGFFTTGDENIPGNYGIWDMIQALKFLQQILPSFNGDPSNVTLFGHSAGGMATSLLTLTPETKDLFARAIPMSGSALSKSSNNPFLIKHSKMVADALEIDFNSFRLRDELIEVSADQIKEAVKSFINLEIKKII
uniref:Carboxylesterase type B domain-containing protein n=1 Tax=Panagrolaimus superbus TaxID=310955 RepID=A0A914Y844_9BILA